MAVTETRSSSLTASHSEDVLDGYDKFCNTAKKLSSLLYELQRDHLQAFSTTWTLLNRRMYQRYIYLGVQDLIPDYILWLKELLEADEYMALVHRLIRFEEDMSSITQSWLTVWKSLQLYHMQEGDRKRRSMINKLAHTLRIVHDMKFPFDMYPKLKGAPMTQWSKLENREEAWVYFVDYVQREWNGSEGNHKRLWARIQNDACANCDYLLANHYMCVASASGVGRRTIMIPSSFQTLHVRHLPVRRRPEPVEGEHREEVLRQVSLQRAEPCLPESVRADEARARSTGGWAEPPG